MEEYINDAGDLYTLDEINQAAKEHNTTFEDIIKKNKLSLKKKKETVTEDVTTEAPGKPKTVVKEDAIATAKSTASKSATPSSDSSNNIFGTNRKFAWEEDQQTTTNGKFDFKKAGQSKEYKKQQAIIQEQQKKQTEYDKAKMETRYAKAALQKKNTEFLTQTTPPQDYINAINAETKAQIDANGKEESYIDYGRSEFSMPTEKTIKINSFQPEKLEVIKDLQKSGTLSKYTQKDILDLAAEKYKKKKIASYVTNKAIDYYSNVDEDTKALKEDYLKKEGNFQNLELQKRATINGDIYNHLNQSSEELNNLTKQLKAYGKNPTFKTQEELDTYKDLASKYDSLYKGTKDLLTTFNINNNDIANTKEKLKSVEEEYDLAKRNYGVLTNVGTRVFQGFSKLGAEMIQIANFMSPPGVKEEVSRYIALSDRNNDEAINNFLGPQEEVTDAKSFAKAGFNLVASQLPNWALMYATGGISTAAEKATVAEATEAITKTTAEQAAMDAGLGAFKIAAEDNQYLKLLKLAKDKLSLPSELQAIAVTSGVGKYNEEVASNALGETNFTPLQMFSSSMLYGYSEALGEKVTLDILKAGGRTLEAAVKGDPEFVDLLKEKSMKNWFGAGFNFVGDKATDFANENLSEQFSNISQNAVDKFVLGKNVNLLDNTGEVFKDTSILTAFMIAAPHVAGLAVKPFLGSDSTKEIKQNSAQIAKYIELMKNPELSTTEKNVFKSKIKDLTVKSEQVFKNTIKNIDGMPKNTFKTILASSNELGSILQKAREIYNSDSIDKMESIKILEEDYKQKEHALNKLVGRTKMISKLSDDFSNKDKGKLFNLNNTAEDLKNEIRILKETSNSDAVIIEKNNQLKDINEKITDIYANAAVTKFTNRAVKAAESAELDQNIFQFPTSEEAEKKANELGVSLIDTDGNRSEGLEINGNIIIDREQAAKMRAFNVAGHEILHKFLRKTLYKTVEIKDEDGNVIGSKLIGSNAVKGMTEAMQIYLNKIDTSTLDNKYFKSRLEAYKDHPESVKAEEVLTIFADALALKQIELNENALTKIGDYIRRVLQDLGFINIEFKDGKDVLNFLKDYNSALEKGKMGSALKKASSEGIKIGENIKKYTDDYTENVKMSKTKSETLQDQLNELEDNEGDYDPDDFDQRVKSLKGQIKRAIEKEKTEVKPTIKKEVSEEDTVKEIINNEKGTLSSDKVQQIYDEKGLNGADEIIKLFRPITNKIVNKRKDAPGFDEDLLRDEIETGEGGIIYLIKSYKPEKGVPLAAYINKQLPLRAIAASKRVLEESFSKDVTEEKGLMAAETASEVKEKPKYKNALESKVFSPELLKSAENKIISVLRTVKSRIDEPISLNRTVTPLVSEIRDEMGKFLDIDIKTEMGGKKDDQLKNFALKNKKYFLENMTTTFLMGKEGQGGVPQAIQKRIDGKWVSYPDWVGKKIDRESVSTDNAGRTSGHELVRRLPNVAENVPDNVYLAQLIGPDGNPIRGRKESWAKAMAEELSFDIINNDLENQGPIYDALATNQQRLGYEMANNFVTNFISQSERGNVKRSKTLKQAQDILEELPSDVKSVLIGANKNTLANFIKTVINSDEVELKFNLTYGADSFKPEYRNKIVEAIKSIYSFYEEKSGKPNAKTYGINLGEDFESFANRKIFNALSKDQSLALTLNIPNTDLQWKTDAQKKSAQINMLNFYESVITHLQNNGFSKPNAQKLFTRLFSRAFSYGKDQSLFDNQEGFFNAFLKESDGFKIGSGEVRGRTILYNNEKVNPAIGAYGQATSAKDITEFIKSGDPSKIDINERKKISATAKKDLETLITLLKEMYKAKEITNTQLGLIFKSLGGSMNSPLKVASELRYVAERGDYSNNPKDWVYEHVPPSSYIARIALGIITGKTDTTIKEFMDKLINNSYVTILPKSFDKSVNEIYKSNMPFYYKIGANPLIRYLDAGFNGKEVPAFYDLYDKKQINNAVVKNAFSSEIIKESQEAVTNSLSVNRSKTPKGISVFDFDDTIGLTKSNVLYTMPDGSTGKLTGEEFAKEGSRLLDEGAVFDFSEFSKVIDGKPGPMVEKMKKMIGKFGPENFFILTARPADSAVPIHQFLSSIGIDIPLENITGLGNSTAQAKADWMTSKAAEGYNDFYFADDHLPNVNAVKNALDVLDVKSKIQQARAKFSKTISPEFNKIIEENTGMENYKVFSDIVARRRGAEKNKFDFYVPPSAADFELLLYNFIGKSKRGEEQQKFFSDALLKPYANGNDLMDAARQSIKNDYKALTDQFPNIGKKMEKLTPDGDFTYDQAIRVAMWVEEGVEIPGISQRDQKKLTELVNNDLELNAFKEGLIVTGRQGKGWVTPTEYWDASTIISDLHNLTEGAGRKKFLAEFIENTEEMFGKFENGKLVGPNINKVEAVYGTNVREAIEDSLYRMINGKNRSYGKNKETSMWANWVTGSTGAIMFLNTRSAALQLIGAVNFLNLRDNNPIAAGKAFANQKQYWEDFARIWNSDKMKERRGGLKEDVAAAEIANAAAGSKNKIGAVLSYLLKIGYTPTQLADSFAIASGGAPFYRNRIKTYLKEGLTQEEAETSAWNDFTKVSDETQQSGDPRDISKQQASAAGRLLLTFQNTAMQQSRIVKKAILDLKNRRGDDKTNIAKIIYYLTIQNIMFSVLQQALFAVAFSGDQGGDDEDEFDKAKKEKLNKIDNKLISIGNDVLDTILRGTGFGGGIAATLKNMYLKYKEEQEKDFKADYAKVMLEGANISPPVGSKLSKLYRGLQQTKFEKDLIKERGWSVMQDGRIHLGPMYGVTGKVVEAITNVPMDRLVNKIENVSQAMNSQNQAWQRVMIGMGWTPYSVGIKDTAGDEAIREKAKEIRAEEGKIKAKETRERVKDSIKNLPIEEKIKLRREKALKRREERLKKRKRKMG